MMWWADSLLYFLGLSCFEDLSFSIQITETRFDQLNYIWIGLTAKYFFRSSHAEVVKWLYWFLFEMITKINIKSCVLMLMPLGVQRVKCKRSKSTNLHLFTYYVFQDINFWLIRSVVLIIPPFYLKTLVLAVIRTDANINYYLLEIRFLYIQTYTIGSCILDAAYEYFCNKYI